MTQSVQAWDDGATWIGQGTVVNNGAISDVSIIITPGAGNEMWLNFASIAHNDATASTVTILIRDAANNTLAELMNIASVTQNSVCQVPVRGTSQSTAGNFPQLVRPYYLSGGMDMIMTAESIDDTEGITWSAQFRTIGGLPTLTTVGGGAETVTTNTNLVL